VAAAATGRIAGRCAPDSTTTAGRYGSPGSTIRIASETAARLHVEPDVAADGFRIYCFSPTGSKS